MTEEKDNYVYVRPIEEIVRWDGKSGKDRISQPQTIRALVGADSKFKVDLTPEEVEEIGTAIGQDLDLRFVPGTDHPFWCAKISAVKLENYTMPIDKRLPMNRIKLAIMRSDPKVANNMSEWKAGKWPKASHVIEDLKSEEKHSASSIQGRHDLIIAMSKLTPEDKIEIIQVLTKTDVSRQTPNYILIELNKLAESRPQELLAEISNDSEERAVKSTIWKAIARNVLKQQGLKIMYHTSEVGVTVQDTIEHFLQPENQNLYLKIKEESDK